jgi:hypothetical protein
MSAKPARESSTTLLTLRAAVVLFASVALAVTVGVLTWSARANAAEGVLAGLLGLSGAVAFFNQIVGD